MHKNIRWKLLLILVVLVAFSAVGVYPILANVYGLPAPGWLLDRQLKLGLDLKGGVHLQMRVERDDALKVETEIQSERLRDALKQASVAFTSIATTQVTAFRVEGISRDQEQAFRQKVTEIGADVNFDRSASGNGTHTFAMKPSVQATLRREAVTSARETIERRVNELGVAEPNIAQQGQDGDRILVELPGMADVNRAKSVIGNPGLLELKLVEQGPFASAEDAAKAYNGVIPQEFIVIPGPSGFYVVQRVAAVTGRELRTARTALDPDTGTPAVSFTLSNTGAQAFGRMTEQNIGNRLAIVLDNRLFSEARINSRITDQGQIAGNFTQQEAQDLALTLRSGALPARLVYETEEKIGPSLGADAVRSGVLASLIGLLMIVVFMLVYYKLSGVNAIIALLFNLIILLGLMAYIGAVMTLPGIAGFVLTMGIGVDSNVLIFERIKEELEANRGVRAAVNAGFGRVFLTLLDTHIAAVIGALFLFQFGTGPIRGFAMTLFLGLASNLFTSTFVSKTLFELALSRRPAHAQQGGTLSI